MPQKNQGAPEGEPPRVDPAEADKATRTLRDRVNEGREAIRRAIAQRAQDLDASAAGPVVHQATEMVLLLPRFVGLLFKLMMDRRVPVRLRIFVAAVLAYVASPLDLMPEGLLGPVGLLDDVVLVVLALDLLMSETDQDILYDHWDGDDNLLNLIQEALGLVEFIVPDRVLNLLRKWVNRQWRKSDARSASG